VGVTVGVGVRVGVAVAVGVGVAPEEQEAPLTRQPEIHPPPARSKPNEAVPPAATAPFHEALAKAWWLAESVRTESHDEETEVPDGRSNSTFQLLMAEPVPFMMVHLPSEPVLQSEVFVQVAVTEAADAECVTATTPTSASNSAATLAAILKSEARDGLGTDGTDDLDIVLPPAGALRARITDTIA